MSDEWMDDAACRGMDPELFFPVRGDFAAVEAARAICRGCSVMAECRAYGLAEPHMHGMWGGLSERERRQVRSRRRQAGRLAS